MALLELIGLAVLLSENNSKDTPKVPTPKIEVIHFQDLPVTYEQAKSLAKPKYGLFKKRPIPLDDLPMIDIRTERVKGFWGKIKIKEVSKEKQRKIKKAFMKVYPDRFFIDDLSEANSYRLASAGGSGDYDNYYEDRRIARELEEYMEHSADDDE